MREKLLQYLNREIENSDQDLDIQLEERGLPKDCSYEDLGLDSDGIPRSHGNSDDVYRDGFSHGTSQGSYNCMLKIKEYVEALN